MRIRHSVQKPFTKRYTAHTDSPLRPTTPLPSKAQGAGRKFFLLTFEQNSDSVATVAAFSNEIPKAPPRRFFYARFLRHWTPLPSPLPLSLATVNALTLLTDGDMKSATQLTVSDAAKRVGVSRQTIFKAIKQGKLSATTSHDGIKQVDVSELLRVYGRLLSPEESAQTAVNRTQQSHGDTVTAALQLELERSKFMLERKDFELDQMRQRVDELRERERAATEEKLRLFGIIERQTLLLSAPKPASAQRVKAAPKATPAPAKTRAKATAAPPPTKRAAARKTTSAKAPAQKSVAKPPKVARR